MIRYDTNEEKDFEKDLAEVVYLCSRWWSDSRFFKEYAVEYAPHLELFRALHTSGNLIYTIGRNAEGQAVSCYVGVKSPYMFNPNLITASEIVWCIDEDYRGYRNLCDLLKEIERLMRANNINIWSLAVSNAPEYEHLGTILEHKGYFLLDKLYSRRWVRDG